MSKENTKEAYQSDWYIIPSRIRRLPGMTLAYLDVYETIFQFLNKGRECFLSNKAICERTGHSLRRVQEAIVYFEQQNELKRVQSGLKQYIVAPEPKIEIEADLDQSQNIRARNRATTRETSRIDARGISPINKEDLNKEINRTPLTPQGECFSKDELELMFDRVWDKYPLKKAKQKAMEAFFKCFRGLGREEGKSLAKEISGGFGALLAEHDAKAEVKAQGGDIWLPSLPHLATWINQCRWKDTYQTPGEILKAATKKKGIIDIDKLFI